MLGRSGLRRRPVFGAKIDRVKRYPPGPDARGWVLDDEKNTYPLFEVRPAIDGSRPRETQASGVGDRPKIAGGRRPADDLPQPRGNLLVSQGEGADPHGQQHLQRFALRRSLAPSVKARWALAAAAAGWFFVGMPATEALAQKAGGVLKIYNRDSPASMSIL